MKLGWWALPLPSSLSLTHLKAVQPPAPKPHVTTEHLKYSSRRCAVGISYTLDFEDLVQKVCKRTISTVSDYLLNDTILDLLG